MLREVTLSENLRVQRARLNISRAELSSRSGVNISTIEKTRERKTVWTKYNVQNN